MDYYRRDPNMLWSPAPFPMLGKYIIGDVSKNINLNGIRF